MTKPIHVQVHPSAEKNRAESAAAIIPLAFIIIYVSVYGYFQSIQLQPLRNYYHLILRRCTNRWICLTMQLDDLRPLSIATTHLTGEG